MSFVFYDTETTGTNTAFDQIVQFGAVRTNHELRELNRFEIRCRLLPYVAPSPCAMRVTGTTVDQLVDPGPCPAITRWYALSRPSWMNGRRRSLSATIP